MIVFKLFYHIFSFIKIMMFKMTYGNRAGLPIKTQFRAGFHLVIEGRGFVKIGKDVFFNNYCTIASRAGITIGDGTIFGENVKIYDHNHQYRDANKSIKNQGYKSAPINIGSHCWIGSNVVILKGVQIGDNCVIGAGCVVAKSIREGSVIVNNQNHLYLS
ncbi:Hexapeptide repeat of succinyl-transferase [Fibrobacter sp. UWCM]|nr:Hexapeptide repeat of succinyl-transferase [Fibrobacter sp. UWCM]